MYFFAKCNLQNAEKHLKFVNSYVAPNENEVFQLSCLTKQAIIFVLKLYDYPYLYPNIDVCSEYQFVDPVPEKSELIVSVPPGVRVFRNNQFAV